MNALTLTPTPDRFDTILAKHDLAETTRYRYGREVKAARAAGVNLLDAAAVSDYAATLPSSRKMFLRAAVGLLAKDIIQTAKATATPENVQNRQAVMWRAESLRDAIHVKTTKGNRAHTWLNPIEVKTLVQLPGQDAKGQRDRVVLALLLGAGLRRNELVNLAWDDIKQQGDRTVLSITGKGNKARVIPISAKLASLLDSWAATAGREGLVCCNVGKGGKLGESLSGQAVLDVVQQYGRMIDKPELRPHDLRRTYARIGYDAGVDIGQISKLLGHASIKTTQDYLGLKVDLNKTVSDYIPL